MAGFALLLRIALVVAYIVLANIALRADSAAWAGWALAVLGPLVAVRGMVAGRAAAWLGALAWIGLAFVLAQTRAAVTLLLLVPSVFLTMACLVFARTLRRGQRPLIVRMAALIEGRSVEQLEPEVRRYATGVTWAWALLLGGMAVLNLFLVLNTQPGGLLARLGQTPPWPVPPSVAAALDTWGVYVPVVVLGVGEFVLRQWRFPGRYRDARDFIDHVRAVPPDAWASLFRR